MKLREGERVLKVYRHHPTPFVFQILKAMAAAFPFFLMLFFFQGGISTQLFLSLNLFVFLGFALLVVYLSLIYWLDSLVVTNFRIVNVDWKYLTIRDEAEAKLDDIQDILTSENGILAHFRIFDYGTIKIDTASSHVTLEFIDAPDPEEMRKFIYHVRHNND
jgi:uncharacterized membrane protein YdbT with pleckstrin-like domain